MKNYRTSVKTSSFLLEKVSEIFKTTKKETIINLALENALSHLYTFSNMTLYNRYDTNLDIQEIQQLSNLDITVSVRLVQLSQSSRTILKPVF